MPSAYHPATVLPCNHATAPAPSQPCHPTNHHPDIPVTPMPSCYPTILSPFYLVIPVSTAAQGPIKTHAPAPAVPSTAARRGCSCGGSCPSVQCYAGTPRTHYLRGDTAALPRMCCPCHRPAKDTGMSQPWHRLPFAIRHPPCPPALTGVRVALVASGGWWQRAQLRQRLLRTSLLSTTQDRKIRGPWAERGQGGQGRVCTA